jgi:ABC-type transporter Mla subunit MlaD
MKGDAAIHVRLPVSPEVVRRMRHHADNLGELARLFRQATETAQAVAEVFERTRAALEHDVSKAKRAARRRTKR